MNWFFTKRLEAFIKHWLYDTLDAQWHWYRSEYQHRGSIHCHGTAKLKNNPGLCHLTKIALKGFLAAKHKKDCANLSGPEQYDQEIENGMKAAKTILGLMHRYPPPWTPASQLFETCAEYFILGNCCSRDTRAQLANVDIQDHSSKLF